jgi:hypothetical protein
LYETAAAVSNVYKIGAKVINTQLGADQNLYTKYATELASSSLWEAHTGATFSTTLALTSVAGDSTNKGWTVTADNTAWTALPSGTKIRFRLKDPATLLAAGVRGIEGIPIIVTKP